MQTAKEQWAPLDGWYSANKRIYIRKESLQT